MAPGRHASQLRRARFAGSHLEGSVPHPFIGTVPVRGHSLRTRGGSISSMTEQTQQPLEQQLEEIGTQLAWVRDYL
jgi:hypothetical protein